MDGIAFDQAVQRMGAGSSRRQVLGGLVGIAAVGLVGGTVAARKGKGKNKSRGKRTGSGGSDNGQDTGGGSDSGQGAGTTKVAYCHKTGHGYVFVTVGEPASPAHDSHGDVLCEDPCVDSPTSCTCTEEGACIPAEGDGEPEPPTT